MQSLAAQQAFRDGQRFALLLKRRIVGQPAEVIYNIWMDYKAMGGITIDR